MPILTNLKTAKISSKTANDPVLVRRSNLTSKLQEQAQGAEALLAGTVFEPKKMIFKKTDDGRRERIEATKRFRPWFWHDLSGSWFLEILYGVRPLPIGKQQETAIVVGTRENLPKILKSLISAVDAGEFDALLADAKKTRKAA